MNPQPPAGNRIKALAALSVYRDLVLWDDTTAAALVVSEIFLYLSDWQKSLVIGLFDFLLADPAEYAK